MNPQIIGILLILLTAGIIFYFIWELTVGRKKARQQYEALGDSEEPDIPEAALIEAEVIGVWSEIGYGRLQMVREHTMIYRVKFQTKDGENLEYEVPEEVFKKCRLHARGTLVLINETVVDFEV